MKLNKLYSNKPKIFPDVYFNEGLNVILGEIRDSTNRQKTTHNIGKSTFINLIDFCLLKGISNTSFWRKNEDVFKDFEFCLEFKYDQGFITIHRGFSNDSRVNILKHDKSNLNVFNESVKWDHDQITISNAKGILDGILDFKIIKPWDFRKITSYLLRVQNDYSDIFRLSKHRGKDKEWKPPLAQLLGLNGSIVEKAYTTDEEIAELEARIGKLERDVKDFVDDPDKLNGLIQLKEEEIDSFQNQIDDFDFKEVEDEINKELVDEIESNISLLNNRRYYINAEINDIVESINRKTEFDPNKTKELFEEVGVFFDGQLKKSYEDLLEFNEKISLERQNYLEENLSAKKQELRQIERKLKELNDKRVNALSKIKEQEVFNKYKSMSNSLNELKLILLKLKSVENQLHELDKRKAELRQKENVREKITLELKEDLKKPSIRYQKIRSSYNNFIKRVLNKNAIIKTQVNTSGNYSFSAPFIDSEGTATSEDDGHTFKKLQCIAFDSSIVMNSLDIKFPHFAIHDGVLETLENRMRLNLLELFTEQAENGLQEIITVLDSHLPEKNDGSKFEFPKDSVIRRLHDQGNDGRLFRMDSW